MSFFRGVEGPESLPVAAPAFACCCWACVGALGEDSPAAVAAKAFMAVLLGIVRGRMADIVVVGSQEPSKGREM